MTKKAYFEQMTRRGFVVNSKSFWNTVKPFVTNKGFSPSDIPPSTTESPNNPLEDSNIFKNIIEEFDRIPYDLLVAKLRAYGIRMNATTFIYIQNLNTESKM